MDSIASYEVVLSEEAGLPGWNTKQILEFTIPVQSDVLYDFPVMLYLSSSSGTNDLNCSDIYDKLGNNSKKIAVTDIENNELFTEIVSWRFSALNGFTAVLHTKVPIINGDSSVLVIQSDTTDGDTTFVDSSQSGHTIFPYDNVQHSTTQAKFGATSIHFDGTSDKLEILNSDDFNVGTEDFTIDWWQYCTTTVSDAAVIDTGSMLLGYQSDTSLSFYASSSSDDSGGPWDILSVSAGNITLNTWEHIALVRKGDTFYMFINGVLQTTATSTLAIFDSTKPFIIGTYISTYFFNGYIDEFRVSKGVARWTTSFTPPTAPYVTPEPTKVRLYFDETHSDNVAFIGNTGETPAQNVWDDNYVLVAHMAQKTDDFLDSTLYGNNITDFTGDRDAGGFLPGTDTASITTTYGGVVLNSSSVQLTDSMTCEALVAHNSFSEWGALFQKGYDETYAFKGRDTLAMDVVYASGRLRVSFGPHTSGYRTLSYSFNGNSSTAYNNAVQTDYHAFAAPTTINSTTSNIAIGGSSIKHGKDHFLDEFRLSNVSRSHTWIKATHLTLRDELASLEFITLNTGSGGEHINPLPGWNGHVGVSAIVDSSLVPSEQTDIPVRISLSESSGLTNEDLLYVLEEYRKTCYFTGDINKEYSFGFNNNNFGGLYVDGLKFIPNDIGIDEYAMYFDGTNDSTVTMPLNLKSLCIESQLTIAFWFRVDDLTVHRAIFGTYYKDEIDIYASTGKHIQLHCGNLSSYNSINTGTGSVTPGVWTHFAYVRDGFGSNKVYLNGVLKNTVSFGIASKVGSRDIRLGDNDHVDPFKGAICDFKIYDTPLSENAIKELYLNRDSIAYQGKYSVVLFDDSNTEFPVLLNTPLRSVQVEHVGTTSIAFTTDTKTYLIYTGSTWKSIASADDTIHGNTGDTSWYWLDNSDNWVLSDYNTANDAIAKAFVYNTMPANIVNTLTQAEFDLLDQSSGMVGIAAGIISNHKFDRPEVTKVTYNATEYWSSKILDLEPYDGIITNSSLSWEHHVGGASFKVYSILTGDTVWTEHTVNGGPISGITNGMNTIGKHLQVKVEFDMDTIPDPEVINIQVKIS
jgi:hypothetical protein